MKNLLVWYRLNKDRFHFLDLKVGSEVILGGVGAEGRVGILTFWIKTLCEFPPDFLLLQNFQLPTP